MPVFNPIMDNNVLGREIKRGIQIGEAKMLRLQIEARFGPVPEWAEKQIRNHSAENAPSLEELLNEPSPR
jgi:hypothetical protein